MLNIQPRNLEEKEHSIFVTPFSEKKEKRCNISHGIGQGRKNFSFCVLKVW